MLIQNTLVNFLTNNPLSPFCIITTHQKALPTHTRTIFSQIPTIGSRMAHIFRLLPKHTHIHISTSPPPPIEETHRHIFPQYITPYYSVYNTSLILVTLYLIYKRFFNDVDGIYKIPWVLDQLQWPKDYKNSRELHLKQIITQ